MSRMIGGEKPQETTKKDDTFFGQLDIYELPEATNSSRLIVSGNIVDFDKLDFLINENQVKSIDLNDANSFSEEIGDLKNGSNLIQLIAKSTKAKKIKKSDTYTVVYKTEKPKLDILTPDSETAKTSSQDFNIKGSTDPDVEIHINRAPAVIDATGSFSYNIRLKEGENNIEIVAQDAAGNTETKSLVIEYRKDD